jgi:S-formylglutathione hydrolase FrmB
MYNGAMAFVDLHYFSNALGKQTSAYVLLPEVGTGPYATLYLLHGLSDDHTIWLRRTSIERYVADLPVIVVMPDGGRGFYCDAQEGYAFETAIGIELVDRIERTFPAKAEREARCLAGLSMGGYGAFKLALSHPDRFAAAVSLSGALAFAHRDADWVDPRTREFARIVGETPSGGPNDLFTLVEKVKKAKNLPALRFDCGVDDFLLDDNRSFRDHLEARKIRHEYAEHAGAHNWEYWDAHIQEALEFFTRVGPLKAKKTSQKKSSKKG